jgi:hypothetical protein
LAKDKTRIYFNIESAGKSKQSTLLINISFRRPPTKHEHPAFRPTHLQTAFGVALVLQKSRREEAVASSRTPRLSESHCQKLFSSVTQAGKRMDRNHLRAIHSQAFCVVMFVQLSTPGNALGYKAPGSSRKKTHPAGRRYGSTKFRICQEHCWFIATRCYKYIIAHSRDYRMIYIYSISQSQGANPSPKLPAMSSVLASRREPGALFLAGTIFVFRASITSSDSPGGMHHGLPSATKKGDCTKGYSLLQVSSN